MCICVFLLLDPAFMKMDLASYLSLSSVNLLLSLVQSGVSEGIQLSNSCWRNSPVGLHQSSMSPSCTINPGTRTLGSFVNISLEALGCLLSYPISGVWNICCSASLGGSLYRNHTGQITFLHNLWQVCCGFQSEAQPEFHTE